jgi:hypothetical protein
MKESFPPNWAKHCILKAVSADPRLKDPLTSSFKAIADAFVCLKSKEMARAHLFAAIHPEDTKALDAFQRVYDQRFLTNKNRSGLPCTVDLMVDFKFARMAIDRLQTVFPDVLLYTMQHDWCKDHKNCVKMFSAQSVDVFC